MIAVVLAQSGYAIMQTAWTIRDDAPIESVIRTLAYHLVGYGG